MTRVLTVLAAAGLALVSGACGPSDPIALVSGRDDHGLLERPARALQRSPTDTTVAGSAQDGAFVRVLRRDGPWAYVRVVARADEGWIDDHYLRAEAIRAGPPPRRVRFEDAEDRGGVAWVLVRFSDDGSTAWVQASELREVGAR